MTLIDELISRIAEATDGGATLLIAAAQIVAIVMIGSIVARLVRRYAFRSLTGAGIDRNVTSLVTNLVAVIVYIVCITLILGIFGVSWTTLLTLIGASSIVLALSLQDLLKSYVAGVYLLLERPFAVGDQIEVNEVEGEVEVIELRTTLLRNKQGEGITVPNATIFSEMVTNRTSKRDDRTTVTLSKLADPLNQVTESIRDVMAELDGASDRPPAIDIVSATEEGASVSVTLFHPAGDELGSRMVMQLRDAFPNADLTVERD